MRPTGSSSHQRILKEYSSLTSSTAIPGVKISFGPNDDISIWTLEVSNFDLGPRLNQDLTTYSTRYSKPCSIVYEIRFPPQYPQAPPFIRIIRPRFCFRTGFVTIGGSICNYTLSPRGWNAQNTIESILIELMSNYRDGGGSLDLNASAYDYSFNEAQDAYRRYVSVHGWN